MILQVSGRTDLVAYYTEWFIERLNKGYCYVRNPFYPSMVYSYDLTPSNLDAIIFCSKNYKPILKFIPNILKQYSIICHYTITAYDTDIEPNVPSIDESIDTLIQLSKLVGKEKVIWRFDPILLTKKYTTTYLTEKFEYIVQKIAPYIQRIIFSFVEKYGKVKKNMPELISLTQEDKIYFVSTLGRIAKKYNLVLQTCGMMEKFNTYGIVSSGCTTKEILYVATKETFKDIKGSPKREGCACMPTKDIGVYNSCPHGCKYCYANQNTSRVAKEIQAYDVHSPILLSELVETDSIKKEKKIHFKEMRKTLFDL